MSTVVTGIAELVTNDPSLGSGPLGPVADAAVVVDSGVVAWVGRQHDAPAADARIEVGGRVVVSEGRHALGDVGRLLTEAIAPLWRDA